MEGNEDSERNSAEEKVSSWGKKKCVAIGSGDWIGPARFRCALRVEVSRSAGSVLFSNQLGAIQRISVPALKCSKQS